MNQQLPPLKKPKGKKLKPLARDGILSSLNLPRNKLVGLSVGVVLVVGGVIALFVTQKSRNSEVRQTLDSLELVVDAVEATDRTLRAAGLAATGDYSASSRLAEKARGDLTFLSERAASSEVSSGVLGPVASATKVSRQVEDSAKALLAARKAGRGDKLPSLRQAKRGLERSSRENKRLTEQLGRVKRQLSREIEGFTVQLEELGSLDGPARRDAEKAARQAGQPTPNGLDEGITSQSEAELALLVERLDWIEPRPGPRSCGTTSEGVEILVNEGRVSCRDAVFVAKNSRGPNESFAPPGWDCSAFASDLEGKMIIGAAGYSCIRTDSARITITSEMVGAASASSGGTSTCDAPRGVTDLVITGATDCDEATLISGRWAEFYGENPDLSVAPTSIPIVDGEDPTYSCDPGTGGAVTCTYRTSNLDGGVEDPGRTISFVFGG